MKESLRLLAYSEAVSDLWKFGSRLREKGKLSCSDEELRSEIYEHLGFNLEKLEEENKIIERKLKE